MSLAVRAPPAAGPRSVTGPPGSFPGPREPPADAVYAAISESATFSRIWRRHVLGNDYPKDCAHISFLTLIELQEMRQRLALSEGAALVDLACGAGGPGLWIAKVADATLVVSIPLRSGSGTLEPAAHTRKDCADD